MTSILAQGYHNPYNGQDFFSFFAVFFQRIWGFLSGSYTLNDLVSDEVQILVLVGVAASSALVGTFLILRKLAMLANSISHTILLGIGLAYLMTNDPNTGRLNIQALLFAAMIMGLLTAFLTEFLTKTGKLQEDASTGLVFTTLFAIGVIFVTLLTRNAHIGLEAVMGNVDALQIDDGKLVYIILFINILLFYLFFKEFVITTFDAGLAKTLGFSTVFFNYLLMVQVSATTIGSFRAVGVLMVLAFITGPPLAARLLTHNLKSMLFLAVGIGVLASMIGVAFARHILTVYDVALSTGGVVVCTITMIFGLTTLFKPILRKLSYSTG
jgi:manganese/zinc/iron transport system permease protein